MSFFVKSVIATVFALSGVLAVWSMFTLMGRSEKKLSGYTLRRLHKGFGFIFLALTLVLTYYCAILVRIGADNLPLRGIIHSVLSLSLLIILLLKLFIVQFYKEFMRFVPVLGISVLVLALLVYGTSAGFYFLARSKPSTGVVVSETTPVTEREGMSIFEKHCAFCHHAEKQEARLGPSLKGLFKEARLPSSGRPATRQNVTTQLLEPGGGMPSFRSTLSEGDIKALLDYLETL